MLLIDTVYLTIVNAQFRERVKIDSIKNKPDLTEPIVTHRCVSFWDCAETKLETNPAV